MAINTKERAAEILNLSKLSVVEDNTYDLVDERDIIYNVYADLDGVIDYEVLEPYSNAIKLTRVDGETFIFELETEHDDDHVTVYGYTFTVYDDDGYSYEIGGDEISGIEGVSRLLDDIASWSEK